MAGGCLNLWIDKVSRNCCSGMMGSENRFHEVRSASVHFGGLVAVAEEERHSRCGRVLIHVRSVGEDLCKNMSATIWGLVSGSERIVIPLLHPKGAQKLYRRKDVLTRISVQ